MAAAPALYEPEQKEGFPSPATIGKRSIPNRKVFIRYIDFVGGVRFDKLLFGEC
jgi:hypothetical protein